MLRLVARSAAMVVLSALVGSVLVFVLLRLIGGDVAVIIAGTNATPDAIEALRGRLGLDRPLWEQYLSWLGGVATGDLGTSYASRYDIADEIVRRLEPTFELILGTLIVSIPIAIALGVVAAVNHRKARGLLIDLVAQFGVAVPPFLIAFVLVLVFAVQFGWLPAGGYTSFFVDPVANIRSMILPVATLSVGVVATLTRFVRSSMIEQLAEDYVRAARAKGRTRRSAAITHALRNASIPLVSISALQIAALITGAVIVENVFVIPGLGRLLLTAVLGREVIVVQSLLLVILLIILSLNLVTDVLYGVLDPRIRRRKARRG